MSRLYELVKNALASGPRTTSEVIAECRRRGLTLRPETIELFLKTAREIEAHDDRWMIRGGEKAQKAIQAIEQAFANGGAYVPIKKIQNYFDADTGLTRDDLHRIAEKQADYQIQGDYIIKKRKQ